MTKFLEISFKLLTLSKVLRVALSCSIVILTISFGASLFVQAKHGCFSGIVSTVIKEVSNVR